MDVKSLLPEGWTLETSRGYGEIIGAVIEGELQGYVTVDEQKRGFALGITPVKAKGAYAGRNWKASLYGDAVAKLQSVLK